MGLQFIATHHDQLSASEEKVEKRAWQTRNCRPRPNENTHSQSHPHSLTEGPNEVAENEVFPSYTESINI